MPDGSSITGQTRLKTPRSDRGQSLAWGKQRDFLDRHKVDNQTNNMQNTIRLALFLFIFLLFFGCSQHVVKQEKHDFKANAQIEGGPQAAEEPSHATPDSNVAASDPDKDVFADSGEVFHENEEGFEEFEDEFGDDEIEEVFDPFIGYNRVMTGINDKLYFWVLNPVAKGYRWIMPEFARRGINNFFDNLFYPVRFVNNVLQLKFNSAGLETVRFVTNSTIGVLGLWDPAKTLYGLKAHPEDFGQTLGHWGVGAGPHTLIRELQRH